MKIEASDRLNAATALDLTPIASLSQALRPNCAYTQSSEESRSAAGPNSNRIPKRLLFQRHLRAHKPEMTHGVDQCTAQFLAPKLSPGNYTLLITALAHLHIALSAVGVQPILFMGSLLGSWRHHDIIPVRGHISSLTDGALYYSLDKRETETLLTAHKTIHTV